MHVYNEIGVNQPMEKIAKLCRSKKIFFHTDAAQAFGKIPIDVDVVLNRLNGLSIKNLISKFFVNERYLLILCRF